jgi:hypothetical protein
MTGLHQMIVTYPSRMESNCPRIDRPPRSICIKRPDVGSNSQSALLDHPLLPSKRFPDTTLYSQNLIIFAASAYHHHHACQHHLRQRPRSIHYRRERCMLVQGSWSHGVGIESLHRCLVHRTDLAIWLHAIYMRLLQHSLTLERQGQLVRLLRQAIHQLLQGRQLRGCAPW